MSQYKARLSEFQKELHRRRLALLTAGATIPRLRVLAEDIEAGRPLYIPSPMGTGLGHYDPKGKSKGKGFKGPPFPAPMEAPPGDLRSMGGKRSAEAAHPAEPPLGGKARTTGPAPVGKGPKSPQQPPWAKPEEELFPWFSYETDIPASQVMAPPEGGWPEPAVGWPKDCHNTAKRQQLLQTTGVPPPKHKVNRHPSRANAGEIPPAQRWRAVPWDAGYPPGWTPLGDKDPRITAGKLCNRARQAQNHCFWGEAGCPLNHSHVRAVQEMADPSLPKQRPTPMGMGPHKDGVSRPKDEASFSSLYDDERQVGYR